MIIQNFKILYSSLSEYRYEPLPDYESKMEEQANSLIKSIARR